MYVSGHYQLSPVVNWRRKVTTGDACHINQLIAASHTLELSAMTGKPEKSSTFLLVTLTHYINISRYTSRIRLRFRSKSH